MDFSQFLDQYMNQKRLQGVTPTRGTATRIFAPYFQDQAQANIQGQKLDMEGKRLDLSRQGLAFDTQKAGEGLAFEKVKNQMLLDAAAKGDNNAMIGNAISSAGSLGNMALLKKYGWFDKRGY